MLDDNNRIRGLVRGDSVGGGQICKQGFSTARWAKRLSAVCMTIEDGRII